ncbi:Cas1p-domain-containing protein [Dothidotthia symphoricarpi CBS 119687]|uniref:Cas1p-domain-containing protein n=1 Tax=Dothidotthia symphoricarpi CBS 119687 TaxID=1392245 RepID=A0A6A5ZZ10_9PLEO|nr:Cas1p-domain-containing protein [Dothidotthia symphoricarpi CBS 119687]KAF2124810.1 Cas1p-domain-containing protein [Dothidotthia symphoricarpi CBS 119687]
MLRSRFVKPASFAGVFDRAALVVVVAVVLVNVYRRLYLDTADPYKCTALLHQGHWLDSPDRNPEHQAFHNWQVPGCMLHDYNGPDIASCNEDGQILFVGDSTTREVFWSVARKLDSARVFRERADEKDTHTNVDFEINGARLKFLWDPWLNSTALRGELVALIQRNAARKQGKELEMNGEKRRSVLIFIGGGLMHARHLKGEYLVRFRQAVDLINAAASSTKSLHVLENANPSGDDVVGDQLFFSPIMEPLYDRFSPSREATITPSKVEAMNKYLENRSLRGLKVPWVFQNMTQGWPELMGESGMHPNDRVASKMADVVLNLRCNAKSAQKDGYPYNRTCCSPYRRPHLVQVLVAVLTAPLILMKLKRRFSMNSKSTSFDKLTAALTIALAIWYCHIADRTQTFDKFPKQFAHIDFWVLLGLAVLSCLVNIESIPSSAFVRRLIPTRGTSQETSFLPREQSDEFKGWMQIYMLAYEYTGASDVLDYYKMSRVFVAFYLFLSGYGHAMHFLQKQDYSSRRLISVVIRLNALPVLLAFAMSRPYTSYYFAPLVSFWFIVVYATLGVGRRFNESLWCVVGKVGISALLVTAVTHKRGVLELLSVVLRVGFRASIDVEEWRFHLGTDKYVAFVGLLVAIIHVRTCSIISTPHQQLNILGRIIKDYSKFIHPFLVGWSLITIPIFWILTSRSLDQADYNGWMPYIAWLPVISFVILRNSTHILRRHYFASSAWLGRIALELHLLSKHIWLAGDDRGLLRIGFRNGNGGFLSDRWRDLVILTPILVWVAWKVHGATATLTAWSLGVPDSIEMTVPRSNHRSRHEDGIRLPDSGLDLPISNVRGPEGSDGGAWKLDLPVGSLKRLLIVVAVVWGVNFLYE